MEIAEHIAVLRREGALLTEAAERGGLDVPVPPCPGWVVRDLVRHMGRVHRWAAAYVRDGRTEPMDKETLKAVFGPWPDDADLVAWAREAHSALVATLESTKPELECWAFLAAPSPLAFWARRQAHETTIHRIDAESAAGGVLSPVPADLAADGIDELLSCFHTRKTSRVRTDDGPATLRITATDADGDWLVQLSDEAPKVTRLTGEAATGPGAATGAGGPGVGTGESGTADPLTAPAQAPVTVPAPAPDCTLSGPAAALYLALWNRGPRDPLHTEGNTALLDLWAERSAITWR